MYVGGRVGSGKFVLANGSVSSKYWTLQVNAILTDDSEEPDACVSFGSFEAPRGGVMSRDRKSRRFVKERELFLKSVMLDLKPAQASSKDPSRDPFHMKPFLSLSNTWFPNQISPLSITTLFFPLRCAKWLKFEPGIYDVTIWSRHDCAKQLIFIGPSSATHYKWPGQTSNSPYLWRQLCQTPDMSEISVGSPIRRSNPTKILQLTKLGLIPRAQIT